MSLETTLDRIANALEAIAASQLLSRPATSEAPVAAPPVAAAPPPVAAPAPPPLAAVPTATVPQPTATLDAIRAAANDFHRAHPDRAAEVVAILAAAGAQKMVDIPPAQYDTVLNNLRALGA